MSSKPAGLIVASALLSSAIVFHAWYPTRHSPDAVRIAWIDKCVAIKGYGKRGIRFSDIPAREPKDVLTEAREHKNLLTEKPENKYAEFIPTADEQNRKKRYEQERECMAEYSILMRGGR